MRKKWSAKIKAKENKKSIKEIIEKTKRTSIKEGCAYAISDGAGLRYITPFALKLGATNAHIGFLTSFPSLIGNFAQLFIPRVMEKTSRKKIAFFGALLQAICWLVVIFIGALFFIFKLNATITPTFLVIVYTLLVLFGAIIVPAWNSWMKDVVTENSGKYFGNRSRIVGLVALVTMLLASFILDYFNRTNIFFGFVILFTIAFIARLISATLMLKKYEPKIVYDKEYYFSFWQFIKYIPKSNFGKFAVFVSLVVLTTNIASPFFSVYMLKELNFTYSKWIIVTMANSLASLLFMPFWGKFADRYGNLKVVKITSFLVPLVPLLWVLSPLISHDSLLGYLIMIELFSGIVWAGFNLCSSNFIYDAVTRQRMALCVAYSNMLQGIGVFIGATLGGVLSSLKIPIYGISIFIFVFFISGIARLLIAVIFVNKIKEVREAKKFGIKEATEKLLTITPKELIKHLDISIKLSSN